MAEVQVRVCDVCKSVGLPITTFTITHGEEMSQLDLCDEHAQPIWDCLELVKPQVTGLRGNSDKPVQKGAKSVAPRKRTAAKAPAKSSRSRVKVVSLDEIEKLKRTAK